MPSELPNPPPTDSGSATAKQEKLVPFNSVERGFLSLAEDWAQAAILAGGDRIMPFAADRAALACLLLAKERASHLGQASKRAIEANYLQRKETHFNICDSLPWELCAVGFHKVPQKATALWSLSRLMGHANSGLRIWGMDLGWICREWLSADRVVPILLKNVADTLGGVDKTLALAAAFFDNEDQFFQAAEAFQAPDGFEDQYVKRLGVAKDFGAAQYQIPFLRAETKIRKLIEDRCFGG